MSNDSQRYYGAFVLLADTDEIFFVRNAKGNMSFIDTITKGDKLAIQGLGTLRVIRTELDKNKDETYVELGIICEQLSFTV